MANQEIKNNEQGIHDHGALNGNTNNDRDIADKKAISDLDKKGNPEDAQLFKDKLLGKNLHMVMLKVVIQTLNKLQGMLF